VDGRLFLVIRRVHLFRLAALIAALIYAACLGVAPALSLLMIPLGLVLAASTRAVTRRESEDRMRRILLGKLYPLYRA
jgi:hypothetical protein